MRLILVVAIFLCLQATQAQYVLNNVHFEPACGGGVGYFQFIQLDTCVPAFMGNSSAMMRQTDTNTITAYEYDGSECTGQYNSTKFAIGPCVEFNEGSESGVFSIVPSPTPPVTSSAVTLSYYSECGSLPYSRLVYNPEYCFAAETTSARMATCNSTDYITYNYKTTTCEGPSFDAPVPMYPCAQPNWPIFECYSPGAL